jgi:hypothetical protein
MFPLTKRSLAALALLSVPLASCSDTSTQPDTAELASSGELPSAVNSWTTRANLPGIERGGLTTAVVQNSSNQSILYALGGKVIETGGSLGKVQAYNAATNTWTHKASMPIAVFATNGAGVIGGKIYVSGGITRDKFFRNELQVYDPATDTWTLKAPMPDDDTWGGVTGAFGGKLYVLTSINQEDSYTDSDRWTSTATTRPPTNGPGSPRPRRRLGARWEVSSAGSSMSPGKGPAVHRCSTPTIRPRTSGRRRRRSHARDSVGSACPWGASCT